LIKGFGPGWFIAWSSPFWRHQQLYSAVTAFATGGA
jgi:hypothetical protein